MNPLSLFHIRPGSILQKVFSPTAVVFKVWGVKLLRGRVGVVFSIFFFLCATVGECVFNEISRLVGTSEFILNGASFPAVMLWTTTICSSHHTTTSIISAAFLRDSAPNLFNHRSDRSPFCWAAVTWRPRRVLSFLTAASQLPSVIVHSQCGHGPLAATDPSQPQPLAAALASCQWETVSYSSRSCTLWFSSGNWISVMRSGGQPMKTPYSPTPCIWIYSTSIHMYFKIRVADLFITHLEPETSNVTELSPWRPHILTLTSHPPLVPLQWGWVSHPLDPKTQHKPIKSTDGRHRRVQDRPRWRDQGFVREKKQLSLA